jgi:hypothetical protein
MVAVVYVVAMSRVTVWIGGGTGSGKTTVTRMFAGRHGLRVFPVDAFWYSHVARLPEPEPEPDQQWLERTPAEQAAEFEALTRRRWHLITADLAALPPSPPVVVEGPQILPDLILPGDQAVFLLPAPAFQRSVLARRPLPTTSDPVTALNNRIAKDRRHGDRVADLAAARGFPVIRVDGTRPPTAILAEVEKALPNAVGHLVDSVDVRAARRWENEIVAGNILSWLRTSHVPPSPAATFPFACECAAPGCDAVVHVAPADFGTATKLAAGH